MSQKGARADEYYTPEPPVRTWRILVVDDEEKSRENCMIALMTVPGYEVRTEQYPLKAPAVAREWRPDLIILDISMPKQDGIALARTLKNEGCEADLIFVTGIVDVPTKVLGLSLATQYITKPYDILEMLARVQVVLRQRERVIATGRVIRERNAARPHIDFVTGFVHVPHGRDATVPKVECQLLNALLDGEGETVPFATLVKKVWGYELAPGEHNPQILQTNISRLRKKIERDSKHPELIITMQRVGYRYMLSSDIE